MMNHVLDLETSWSVIAPILTIQTEEDYCRGVEQLNFLIDTVGTNEEHPLYSLLETLGVLTEAYEDQYVSIPEVSGVEVLKHFMDEFDLTQSDFPEVGSQGVMSEILNGKRELNLRQVKALGERFHVSASVFV